MAGVTASITSPDLTEQIKRLGAVNVNRVTNKHGFEALNTSTRITFRGWKDVTAVDTGLYKGTLKVDIKPIAGGRILQGAVRTFAMSPAGFPYPRALEDSTRYHYRSTKRRGQQTAGQMARMFLNKVPLINKLFARAGDRIVKDLAVK